MRMATMQSRPDSTVPFGGISPANGAEREKAHLPAASDFSDTEATPKRSPLKLIEDSTPLGPPHSVHADIFERGWGCYSHWSEWIYFATSDNSDPNENGRRYRIEIDGVVNTNFYVTLVPIQS